MEESFDAKFRDARPEKAMARRLDLETKLENLRRFLASPQSVGMEAWARERIGFFESRLKSMAPLEGATE